jgi:hypothetical protein
MTFRFAVDPVSLRDRFRPAATTPVEPRSEASAATALAGKRGRATIPPPPRAGKAAASIMKPLLGKGAGMGLNELKRRWADVVGPSFARATPEKLTAGTLTVRAPGALAPFLQQQAPLLVDRLKLAGCAVKAVRIEQRAATPAKVGNVRPLKRKLTTAEDAALAQVLDPVSDPGLKSALLRLGRAVKQG